MLEPAPQAAASDAPADLVAGDEHYRAYVGPPNQYDFMGATQFRLLTTLGLRAHHKLLDFGCGSLRAGRLLMTYLDAGCYCGVEPNRWLVEAGIRELLGDDMVRLKQPRFSHNKQFKVSTFGDSFDWIVAQSVLSHTGQDLLAVGLRSFAAQLSRQGRIVATFFQGDGTRDGDEQGWVYPGCVLYRNDTVRRFAYDAGLDAVRLPWYHPRQTWWIMARDTRLLPSKSMLPLLRGVVLFDDELDVSWKQWAKRPLRWRMRQALGMLRGG